MQAQAHPDRRQEDDATARTAGELRAGSASMTLPLVNPGVDAASGRLETAALAAVESRADRKLTDTEWAMVRRRLLEFVGVLRSWEKPSQRGNVVVLCQREP